MDHFEQASANLVLARRIGVTTQADRQWSSTIAFYAVIHCIRHAAATGRLQPGRAVHVNSHDWDDWWMREHASDLDPAVNPKLDDVFEMNGVPVVVDKRSQMYLEAVQVDYHDDLNKRGFSISNPSAKTTCGCGSSFSM